MIIEVLRHPYVKDGEAIGKIIEYCGEAVQALGVDERATLTNMAAEIGAFTGLVAPDERTVEWLVERRGMSVDEARALTEGFSSDEDAEYEWTMQIDASTLEPMVATPGDPGNGVFVSELEAEVPIDLVFAGACTGAKREDFDMYARVVREALEAGRTIPDSVDAYIQYGSLDVEDYARRQGYEEMFTEIGFRVLAPGCGACINAGPGVSTSPDQVTISSINRNFPGRSGPGKVYLASPYTVMASAIAGRVVAYEPKVMATA
jgi:3-isopropylmalate/(R)-2-methylmalate dehydratase large subunit